MVERLLLLFCFGLDGYSPLFRESPRYGIILHVALTQLALSSYGCHISITKHMVPNLTPLSPASIPRRMQSLLSHLSVASISLEAEAKAPAVLARRICRDRLQRLDPHDRQSRTVKCRRLLRRLFEDCFSKEVQKSDCKHRFAFERGDFIGLSSRPL